MGIINLNASHAGSPIPQHLMQLDMLHLEFFLFTSYLFLDTVSGTIFGKLNQCHQGPIRRTKPMLGSSTELEPYRRNHPKGAGNKTDVSGGNWTTKDETSRPEPEPQRRHSTA